MNSNRLFHLGVAVVIFCILGANTIHGAVIYVDSDSMPGNDGQSWETAFKYLQDALAVATYGDEIRVAEGSYRPDESFSSPEGTGEPNNFFELIDGVILQGGYAGWGTANPDENDIAANETILSGDLNGDDSALSNASQLLSDPSRSENSDHVIFAVGVGSNTILDGFTISGGIADSSDSDNVGGAIRMALSSPMIQNCRFEYNAAANGGAIYNLTANPLLKDCVFFRNYAQNAGGALRNITSSNPQLTTCTFIENKASGFGGAMANSNNSSPIVMRCIFSYNWANQGGAINNFEFCSPLITQSKFLYNATDVNGGALSNQNHSDSELINCGLFSNAAPYGAGLYNYQSSPHMVNCVASGNMAVESGGVLYNRDAIDVTMTNCTLVGNTAAIQGASIYNVLSNSILQNCILWYNIDPDQNPIFIESGTSTVNYSCIQGGWIGGTGNIEIEPMFVDPNGQDGLIGTIDDNFSLLPESLCIDAGDNTVVPADYSDLDNDGNVLERIPIDYIGRERFINIFDVIDVGLADLPMYPGVIDMGAMERKKPILVDILSPGPEHDGTDWSKAFYHLQDALAIAEKGDLILVAQGVYCPDPNKTDPTTTFELIDGVVLKGGYAGWSQIDPNVRDFEAYPTILSGDLLGNDTSVADPVQMFNDPSRSDNSYHVITANDIDKNTKLSGFTITGGMAAGASPDNTGGGILMVSSNPIISDCNFEYNLAEYGAAVYNSSSNPMFTDCFFLRNYALNHGGCLRNYDFSNPELSVCTFSENKAAGYGGAMANSSNSSPNIMQCNFLNNWANQGGAAINNYGYCNLQITQSIFEYNITDNTGGALRSENYSDVEAIDCDFTANTAFSGGAIYNISSDSTLIDCNLFDNAATGNGGAISSVDSSLSVQTSAFMSNQSNNYGGALCNVALSLLNIADCTFTSNTSIRGGAVFCENSASVITDSTFLNNTTTNGVSDIDESGGAIYNDSEDLLISQSIFRNNESYINGGAVYNINGDLSIENGVIRDNQSGKNGGGICSISAETLNIANCIVSSNTTIYDGGGIYIQNSTDADIINSLVTYNHSDYGGGIASFGVSNLTFAQCTISENTAGIGDGIYNSSTNSAMVNSILLGSVIPSDSITIDYSCVPNWSGAGNGNTIQSPDFVDPDGQDNFLGTEDDNFRLTSNSPCLNAANNSLIPVGLETDLDGHLRIIDGNCSGQAIVVDMGAYEFSQISMGDFNLSCSIDFIDFIELADAWLTTEGEALYNSDCDISIPPDHMVDGQDLIVFCQNWLAEN